MRVEDINSNVNVAGAGINVAQRVMDLAGPGQILASVEFSENILRTRVCTGRYSLMSVNMKSNTGKTCKRFIVSPVTGKVSRAGIFPILLVVR